MQWLWVWRRVEDSDFCCCCSVTKSCPTICNPKDSAHHAPLSSTISWSLLKLMSVESVIPSNHLMLCRPLLLLFSIFPSIRVYSNELAPCVRWPVQGTLKSVLQHHSSKASIFRRSAFFTVQLSHPYMTTGKTIAPTICYLKENHLISKDTSRLKVKRWEKI